MFIYFLLKRFHGYYLFWIIQDTTGSEIDFTLKCIRGGGSLGSNISFFPSLVKTRTDFSPFLLLPKYSSFCKKKKKKKKKKDIGSTISTLISINWHYCAMSQNLFWSPFLNRIFFFFKFYFKNINVFMSPTLSEILLQKSFEKVVFQILITWLVAKRKFVFWPPFWNGTFFECSFCWFMVVLGAYRYSASFVPKFVRESI